jgi:hypothetical protein
VGSVVFAQLAFVVGSMYLAARLTGETAEMKLMSHLPYGVSSLSYDFFPFALLFGGSFLGVVLVALNVVAASVFITAHFLGVQDGYVEDEEVGEGTGAANASETRPEAVAAAEPRR